LLLYVYYKTLAKAKAKLRPLQEYSFAFVWIFCCPLWSNNPSRRAPEIKDGGATWICQHPRGQHVICGISREQSRNNTTYNMIIDSAICHYKRWGCSRLLRPVWAENKQSLTTHSTVMAERDQLGKQAVTSKGAAGLYKKTSNPWQPTSQLWQSVIDWESRLSRPRVLPVRTKKQAILDDPLHSYGRAWSIGKASCHVQGCCRFVQKKQAILDNPLHSYGRAWSIGKASCHVQGCYRRQILRLYRNDEEDACLVGHGKGWSIAETITMRYRSSVSGKNEMNVRSAVQNLTK
jgi:hypothetical protein